MIGVCKECKNCETPCELRNMHVDWRKRHNIIPWWIANCLFRSESLKKLYKKQNYLTQIMKVKRYYKMALKKLSHKLCELLGVDYVERG